MIGYIGTGDYQTAYLLSRDTPTTTNNPRQIIKMANRWVNSEKCREFIASRQTKAMAAASANAPTDRTRAEAVAELNSLINSVTDPKTRADLLLKLSDLQKWRRDEDKQEADRVQYYIPLSAHRCIEYAGHVIKERLQLGEKLCTAVDEIVSDLCK